jgi:hypothetical protein
MVDRTPNLSLEDVVIGIVNRIKEIDTKIKFLQNRWTPIGMNTATVEQFMKGKIYSEVKYEDDELKFEDRYKHYILIGSGKLRKLAEEISKKILERGFTVVVVPDNINKSAVASAVIWELPFHVGISLIARVYRFDKENYSGVITFINKYYEELGKYVSGRLLILHDPDLKVNKMKEIEETINNLINLINSMSYEVKKPLVFIVLSESIYNMLDEKTRNVLEQFRFDVPKDFDPNSTDEEEG